MILGRLKRCGGTTRDRRRVRGLDGLALVFLALPLFFAAVSGGPRQDPEPGATSEPAQKPAEPTQKPVDSKEEAKSGEVDLAFAQALDRAIEEGWKEFHLNCECLEASGRRAVEVFSSGAAIWGERAQFRLERGQLRTILELARQYGFPAMKATYGGKGDPAVPENFAIRVTCLIQLTIDGVSKQVAQLEHGRQSKELRQLAGEIFKLGEASARDGVEAESLQDALTKISTGELAPEALRLVVYRKPDADAVRAGASGWLLQIEGGQASARPLGPEGLRETRVLDLDAETVRSLGAALAKYGAADLPRNLYAEHYTDFSLKVLRYKQTLQARQFAGMTPETHGEKQKRFDGLFAAVAELGERVIAEGVPEAQKR